MGNETQNSGTSAAKSGGSLVQSVDRAVTVLEILARHGEAGVTEIAEELGVHKSTAFRLVGALEQRRLVEQTADRGKYELAYGIVRLAGAASAQMEITRESRASCEQLAEESGEGAVVAALSISGPSYRLSPEVFPQLARMVRTAAAEISARIERRG
jgi:DNA-binding IclR family transcriptional regulator